MHSISFNVTHGFGRAGRPRELFLAATARMTRVREALARTRVLRHNTWAVPVSGVRLERRAQA
eukprot:1300482-Prymnesium_polylepis.1